MPETDLRTPIDVVRAARRRVERSLASNPPFEISSDSYGAEVVVSVIVPRGPHRSVLVDEMEIVTRLASGRDSEAERVVEELAQEIHAAVREVMGEMPDDDPWPGTDQD